jgi:hypothetical protein
MSAEVGAKRADSSPALRHNYPEVLTTHILFLSFNFQRVLGSEEVEGGGRVELRVSLLGLGLWQKRSQCADFFGGAQLLCLGLVGERWLSTGSTRRIHRDRDT